MTLFRCNHTSWHSHCANGVMKQGQCDHNGAILVFVCVCGGALSTEPWALLINLTALYKSMRIQPWSQTCLKHQSMTFSYLSNSNHFLTVTEMLGNPASFRLHSCFTGTCANSNQKCLLFFMCAFNCVTSVCCVLYSIFVPTAMMCLVHEEASPYDMVLEMIREFTEIHHVTRSKHLR